MALSNELVHTLIAHRGEDMETITHILNEYNSNQTLYNRLNGEDTLNAYKLAGIYHNPDCYIVSVRQIVRGKTHDKLYERDNSK